MSIKKSRKQSHSPKLKKIPRNKQNQSKMDWKCGKLYHLTHTHTPSPLYSGYFGDRVSQTICLGWPQAMILQISASQLARIIGMSHWCLSGSRFIYLFLKGYESIKRTIWEEDPWVGEVDIKR
jgi:hypothetical protein